MKDKTGHKEEPLKSGIFSEEDNNNFKSVIGLFALGVVSVWIKEMLEKIDYKINSESLSDLIKLDTKELNERLDFALKEKRYEDAAKFLKILAHKDNSETNNEEKK